MIEVNKVNLKRLNGVFLSFVITSFECSAMGRIHGQMNWGLILLQALKSRRKSLPSALTKLPQRKKLSKV